MLALIRMSARGPAASLALRAAANNAISVGGSVRLLSDSSPESDEILALVERSRKANAQIRDYTQEQVRACVRARAGTSTGFTRTTRIALTPAAPAFFFCFFFLFFAR